jgi:TetR/AcrR family transcriptional regulator, copper-responsive repressor
MVQKEPRRPRGRPREYDPQLALGRAMDAFWDAGFSGTSLDDLGARMRMNRPSLYAAFGDKEALYLQTLERYLAERRALIASAFSSGQALPEAFRQLYYRMIDRFLEGDRGARGCFLLGTAVTEAVVNKEIRKMVVASEREMDGFLQGVFAAAQARGEIGPEADRKALAVLAWAITHTLALRARAGQPREALREIANSAVNVVFAAAGRGKSRRAARAPSSRRR